MKKIAIFASGSGSNAIEIIKYFSNHENISVKSVITNNPEAGIIDKMKRYNYINLEIIPTKIFKSNPQKTIAVLQNNDIDFIVLAGFLLLIPKEIITLFPKNIINIHPALLPKYGGKGMYGSNVHIAVKKANEHESGITIHYVNEKYDDGDIIFQAKCKLNSLDSPKSIAKKVLALEHKNYKVIIENILIKNI